MERNIANELNQIVEYLLKEKERRINYLGDIAREDDKKLISMFEDIENIEQATQLLRSAIISLEVSGI